jgi:hypothetical protein
VVASVAGAAAESGLQIEELPLTGSIIINGTGGNVSDVQGLAGRASVLLPDSSLSILNPYRLDY